jgi:glycosyltransferase involved in cell wall biosynthesis
VGLRQARLIVPAGLRASPLDASWRELAERVQEQQLPHGRALVSCQAPLGVGGLGRHVSEILDALERAGQPAEHLCGAGGAAQTVGTRTGIDRFTALKALAPLTRFSPAARVRIGSARFDARAARQLGGAEHLIAFNGTALAQFRAARSQGFESLSLVSANSHMRQLTERHARAYRSYPLERPWATRIVGRNLREYALADRIYVSSSYIRDSFLREGFSEELLASFPLTPDPRYRPTPQPSGSGAFELVYVGSLVVHKGVPLLLDAFQRLPHPDLRLTLVGGWKTRSMRRHLQAACARDPRISIHPGDPLPHLQRAHLCVHPAYEDGFAYAPAEALACGVPVLVSADTGMKELIEDDSQGLVLATGDLDALVQAIEAAYRGEILSG